MENFVLDFFEGLSNIDFNFVWTLFGIALGAFWIVVLYWVWLDSGERTTKKSVRIAYLLLVGLLFVVGLIIYMLIRPNQTIQEIYWADLERRYLKYETAELGDCPKCGTQLFPGFTYCPNCRYVLKVKCTQCEVEMDKQYRYCPSCGNQMRERIQTVTEELPTKEVMEEQIQASKEEAAGVVESNRVRYIARKGVAEVIGDKITNLVKKLFQKNPSETTKKETNEEEKTVLLKKFFQKITPNVTNKEKSQEVQEESRREFAQIKKNKKKKNKKRR